MNSLINFSFNKLNVGNLMDSNSEMKGKFSFFKKLYNEVLVKRYMNFCDTDKKFNDEKEDFENVKTQNFFDIFKMFLPRKKVYT